MRGTLTKGIVLAVFALILTAGSLAAQGFTCQVVAPSNTWVWSYDKDSTFSFEVWVNSSVQCNGGSLGLAVNRRIIHIDSVKLGPEVTGVFPNEIAANDSVFTSPDDTMTFALMGQLSFGTAIIPTAQDVLFGTIYITYKYDSLASIEPSMVKMYFDSAFIPPAGEFVLTDALGQNIACTSFSTDSVEMSFSSVTDINPGVLPAKFELTQNYPNPFNPDTKIEFAVPQKSQVDLVIYNVMGQKVKTLISDVLDAGWKQVTWDGTDDFGNTVASGMYLYKLNAGDFVDSKKMSLVK